MRGLLERHDGLRWAVRSRLWRWVLPLLVVAFVLAFVSGPAWLGAALALTANGVSVGYGLGRRDERDFHLRLDLESVESEMEGLLAALPEDAPQELRVAMQRARQEAADELRRIGRL